MTEEQKIKIIELRNQGLGYKRIAKQLKEPFSEYITSKKKKMKKINKIEKRFYLNCNKEIIQSGKGPRRKYCCNKCRYSYKNSNRKTYNIRCEYCGEEFKDYSVKRKYCSHDLHKR